MDGRANFISPWTRLPVLMKGVCFMTIAGLRRASTVCPTPCATTPTSLPPLRGLWRLHGDAVHSHRALRYKACGVPPQPHQHSCIEKRWMPCCINILRRDSFSILRHPGPPLVDNPQKNGSIRITSIFKRLNALIDLDERLNALVDFDGQLPRVDGILCSLD